MSEENSRFDFSLDPFVNFEIEFQRASATLPKDQNAMSLATASASAVPSVRTVLYKGLVRGGLSFYTNYESQKSQEMTENSRASALFFWSPLDLQIRFEGQVFRLTRAESEAYFSTRPRLSQLGAWASTQSRPIPSRQVLEERLAEFTAKYQNQDVPCPPQWGGWHLIPLRIEFWYGQTARLHDRFVYERSSLTNSDWQRLLKAP